MVVYVVSYSRKLPRLVQCFCYCAVHTSYICSSASGHGRSVQLDVKKFEYKP